jgi:RNA polymerase sigma-70 factor (ECF subfamily)
MLVAYKDEILMQDFFNGERKAFEEVYNQYYSALVVFCTKITLDYEESKDIVIKLFTVLFQKHKDFECIKEVRSFLYVSAKNRSIDYLRHKKYQDGRYEKYVEQFEEDEECMNDQIEGELLNVVYKSFATLPPQCRRIVEMIYIDRMKHKDIAKKLNITLKTVYNLQSYAIKRLKERLPRKTFNTFLMLV